MNFKDIKKLSVGDLVKDIETGAVFKVIKIDLSRDDLCPLRVELTKTSRAKFNTSTWGPTNEQLLEAGDQAWLFLDEYSALIGANDLYSEDCYIDIKTVLTCEDLVLA